MLGGLGLVRMQTCSGNGPVLPSAVPPEHTGTFLALPGAQAPCRPRIQPVGTQVSRTPPPPQSTSSQQVKGPQGPRRAAGFLPAPPPAFSP